MIGAITSGNMTFSAWRSVFLLGAAIYFAGNAAYVLLIDGETQKWNYPKEERDRRAPLDMEEKSAEEEGENEKDSDA